MLCFYNRTKVIGRQKISNKLTIISLLLLDYLAFKWEIYLSPSS